MPGEKRLDSNLFTVEAGTRTPFTAAGLRIPLGPEAWVAVDFEQVEKATLVSLAARGKDRGRKLPALTMHPHAGNVLSVKFGVGDRPHGELEVFSVSYGDLEGDLLDWLPRTHSGDPLGEILLDRGDRKALAAREFHIDHSNYGRVEIKLSRSPDLPFSCRLSGLSDKLPVPGEPFRALDLIVKPRASNLASVCFREMEGVMHTM